MINKISIIYILNSSTNHGGANKSFLFMIEGLIEKGVAPCVILPRHGGICDELNKRKIQFIIITYYHSIYPSIDSIRDIVLFFPRLFRTLYYNRLALKKIIDYVKIIHPLLIHTNVGPIHLGYKAAKVMKIPHVWHIREYQVLGLNMHPLFSMKSFQKKIHSKNNYLIPISHGIYKYFSMGINAKVIYNGIYRASQTKFIVEKKRFFLFAGRLEKNKGIIELINVFAEFAKTNSEYALLVAGDTTDHKFKKSLLAFIKKLGVEERVIFLGMLDNINDVMSQATALIVPSYYEGFGRTTAEAMFNGCLVVGNNSGGTKEILENENLGILYSGNEELLDAMKMIVGKGIKSFFPMIIKAQKNATINYSVEKNVKSVFSLYQYIINKNNK